MGILLGILTFVLICVSLFLMLVILAQKSKDGGMGAALGGGAAEAAFGAETSNVLSKATIYSAVLFFLLAFLLYLGRIYERNHALDGGNALPSIAAPAASLPSSAAAKAAPFAPAPAPGAAQTAPITAPKLPTAPATTSSPTPTATPSAQKQP